MSHKGKAYPVLFRRDWNLNLVTNRNGWANRYIFVEHDSTTGFGTIIRGQRFDCGPATVRFVNDMRWTSQVVHIGIFDFQVVLHAAINPSHFGYDTTFDINELNVGTIATVRRRTLGDPHIGFDQGQFDETTFFDPAWYDHYPTLESSTCRQKLWSDGPPH